MATYRTKKARLVVTATDFTPGVQITCTLDIINQATGEPYSAIMGPGDSVGTRCVPGVLHQHTAAELDHSHLERRRSLNHRRNNPEVRESTSGCRASARQPNKLKRFQPVMFKQQDGKESAEEEQRREEPNMNFKPKRAPSKARQSQENSLLSRCWTRMMAVALVTLLSAASAFASSSVQIANQGINQPRGMVRSTVPNPVVGGPAAP